jgi:hypothetical protein
MPALAAAHAPADLQIWRYRAPVVLGGAMMDGGAAIGPRGSLIPPDADGCPQPI